MLKSQSRALKGSGVGYQDSEFAKNLPTHFRVTHLAKTQGLRGTVNTRKVRLSLLGAVIFLTSVDSIEAPDQEGEES